MYKYSIVSSSNIVKFVSEPKYNTEQEAIEAAYFHLDSWEQIYNEMGKVIIEKID